MPYFSCISCGTKACSCTRITTFSAVSILFFMLYITLEPEVEKLQQWLISVDAISSCVIFLLLFTITSFPLTWGYIVVNFAAGYRFGIFIGYAVTIVCVCIGSFVAFYVCRVMCGPWLTPKLQADYLQSIMTVVEGKDGFRVIALTRFTPIPFGLQNGLFAMSRVSSSTFAAASCVGLLPTQALNVYVGSTLRTAQDPSQQHAFSNGSMVFQIVASVFLSLYIVHVAQKRLHKKLEYDTNSRQDENQGKHLLPVKLPVVVSNGKTKASMNLQEKTTVEDQKNDNLSSV